MSAAEYIGPVLGFAGTIVAALIGADRHRAGGRPGARSGRSPGWPWLVAAAVSAGVAIGLTIYLTTRHRDKGATDGPRAVLIEPAEGPSGTVVEISGDPCRTVPEGEALGGIVLGVTRGQQTLTTTDISLHPGKPWKGTLRIPQNTSPGVLTVYAHCKAFSPKESGTPWKSYGDDRSGTFKVT